MADWVGGVVERYERQLILYARHVLGPAGDLERARDIVQEAFLRLISQDRAKISPHLAEWLYTVCRNLAIDARRKARRSEPLKDADADSATADSPEPSAPVEQADSMSQVMRAMNLLPHNQQECIRLKFQGGLSYKEISEVTGLSVTNIGFLIHTGLKTVRQRVADEPAEVGMKPTRESKVARKQS